MHTPHNINNAHQESPSQLLASESCSVLSVCGGQCTNLGGGKPLLSTVLNGMLATTHRRSRANPRWVVCALPLQVWTNSSMGPFGTPLLCCRLLADKFCNTYGLAASGGAANVLASSPLATLRQYIAILRMCLYSLCAKASPASAIEPVRAAPPAAAVSCKAPLEAAQDPI